jgi:hypothetical protein
MPQAWAASVAQAGLLRDRQQSEKSQGFGDRVPESFPDQTKTKTVGKSALAFSTNRRFTLNQYSYSIFTVSASLVNAVSSYIERQEVRHRKMTFEEELKQLLEKHGVKYDPKYLL